MLKKKALKDGLSLKDFLATARAFERADHQVHEMSNELTFTQVSAASSQGSKNMHMHLMNKKKIPIGNQNDSMQEVKTYHAIFVMVNILHMIIIQSFIL
jgi:hypothetical protein